MELRDYEISKVTIPLPGKQTFEVRGLTTADIAFLVQNHLEAITRSITLYQETRADMLKGGNMARFIMSMTVDAPDLVAEIISAAADALDDRTRSVAKQLPLPVQIAALSEIVKLTMEESGGLKNLLAETLAKLGMDASALDLKPRQASITPPKAN